MLGYEIFFQLKNQLIRDLAAFNIVGHLGPHDHVTWVDRGNNCTLSFYKNGRYHLYRGPDLFNLGTQYLTTCPCSICSGVRATFLSGHPIPDGDGNADPIPEQGPRPAGNGSQAPINPQFVNPVTTVEARLYQQIPRPDRPYRPLGAHRYRPYPELPEQRINRRAHPWGESVRPPPQPAPPLAPARQGPGRLPPTTIRAGVRTFFRRSVFRTRHHQKPTTFCTHSI